MARFDKTLIIDDNSIITCTNILLIKHLGLSKEVIHVFDGKEALQLLLNDLHLGKPMPDLILLDIYMPVMDGFEFLEKITSDTQLAFLLDRIIMLTGSSHRDDITRIKELGVGKYLTKPLTSKKLLEVIPQ